MQSRFLRTIFILCLLGLIGFGIYKGWIYGYNAAINIPVDAKDTGRQLFKIQRGETVKAIGERLDEEDVIINKHLFYWYVRINNIGESIQAGQFVLQKSFTIPEIVNILTQSKQSEIVVSVIEGWTIEEIDQKLTSLELIQRGEFTSCANNCDFSDIEFLAGAPSLEGYLFPDTYFIDPWTFTPEKFIRRMLDNFNKKLGSIIENSSLSENYSLHEYVIMASIIEREVRTDEDRPIVSGILWKRYKNGWMLGADATLLYMSDDNTINAADLEEDSPYNTRKNAGLPPTAISNPGLKSLEAAYFPEESEYWFYLTMPETGKVIYAVSNEEHNLNKTKYL